MIPPVTNRLAASGGVTASAPFGISEADTAHIMGILREGLYSDRIAALLREYAANAWDAHMEAGIGLIPILVHVPMHADPNLRIRDYGPGLSPEEVFTVYNQYGRSSKRGSNLAVGQLGIGSKSAFCYADSFTITSYHGGYKRIYAAVIDASNLGRIDLLYEEPSTETGVEIQIAVKTSDVHEFHTKARALFRHFRVRPQTNLDLPPPTNHLADLAHGSLCASSEGTGWLAIMGCVPYRVSLIQINTSLIGDHIHKLGGELYFPIGSVEMSANREELKYTDATKAAIVAKINDLVDEYVTHTMNAIDGGVFTSWERRLRAQVLTHLDLPVPTHWKELTDYSVKIDYQGMNFTLIHNKAVSTRVSIDGNTRILIDDTGKELSGYHITFADWVMRPLEGSTVAQAQADLASALAIAGLTGVTIQLLSTIPWVAPYKKPPKQVNPKHKVKVFKLVPSTTPNRAPPWSDSWVPAAVTPSVDDVFVVIRNFKALEYANFFNDHRLDSLMAANFGGIVPPVYGYKSTKGKPVDTRKLMGTAYDVWRQGFPQQLLTPETLTQIAAHHWSKLGEGGSVSVPHLGELKNLITALGEGHPITAALNAQAKAQQVFMGAAYSRNDAVAELAKRTDHTFAKSEAKRTITAIYQRYPLLQISSFAALWDYRHRSLWSDYVQTIDRLRRLAMPSPVTYDPDLPLFEHLDGSWL